MASCAPLWLQCPLAIVPESSFNQTFSLYSFSTLGKLARSLSASRKAVRQHVHGSSQYIACPDSIGTTSCAESNVKSNPCPVLANTNFLL